MGEDPTKKISFNIICEPFTQANDNLFPYDSQSQNDNILLKIWVNVYNYKFTFYKSNILP